MHIDENSCACDCTRWVTYLIISSKKWGTVGNSCIFPGANCRVRSPCTPIIVWWEGTCQSKPNALFFQVLGIGYHYIRQHQLLWVGIPAVGACLGNVITPQAFILRLPILKVKNAHSFLGVILELSLVNVAIHCGHTQNQFTNGTLKRVHPLLPFVTSPCHTWHF
jgi:hypothetical protein